MKRSKRSWALVAAAIGMTTAACGGGGGGTDGPVDPVPGTVATIEVSPTPLNLLVGGSGGLTAIARDNTGAVIAQTAFTWASTVASIASVTGTTNVGAVVGLVPGTTRVTAKLGSIEGSATVNVQQPVLTLQVVPATASTNVGGTVAFSVVARDGNGVIQAAPAVTSWTSSSQTVATISTSGVATGRAAGVTQIGATAGTLVATPAVLTVTNNAAGACENIANIATWDAQIDWKWARNRANGENHFIAVDHSVRFKTTFTRELATGTLVRYSSPPGGTASVNDADTDRNGPTPRTQTLRGNGAIATNNVGIPLPGFLLEIDLTNCTYRFEGSVSMTMTLTQSDGRAETATLPLGNLRTEWTPVGPWRQLGLSDTDDGPRFPAHSLLWAPTDGKPHDVYVPFGFGQLIFIGVAAPNEASEGDATSAWVISAK